MRWIFNKFRGGGSGAGLMCYLRENGPIAYVFRLFGADPRPRLEALLDTGFAWFWRCGDQDMQRAPGEWTQVTRWSMAALLTDLGSGAAVSLLGFQSADMPNALSDDQVIASLRAFAAEREGPFPLQVVLRRGARRGEGAESSLPEEHVFVAQQPPEPVRILMQAWGIDPIKAERRAYARLRELSLEEWLRALTAPRDDARYGGSSSSAPSAER
jgi:hypothetical protein